MAASVVEPPQRLRLRYYLFEIRLPPVFLEWAERDIASPAWLWREIARLFVLYVLLTLVFARARFTLPAVAVLLCGVGAILAARTVLRNIAVAYQRYGWDWDANAGVGSPYLRVGLAVVFAAVIVLLAR